METKASNLDHTLIVVPSTWQKAFILAVAVELGFKIGWALWAIWKAIWR